jgi:HTH-type transcriptional regulator/antitoxin HipB
MAKKPSKTTYGTSGDMARSSGEAARAATAAFSPLEQAQRDLADRIQPALKLSELVKTSEGTKAISAQQKVVEQVRAKLQLPQLEALTKQAAEAAAVVSKNRAGLTRARDIAKGAASTIPALAENGFALPSPPTDRPDDTESSMVIRSAQDMGRLVREAREQRKLSQQAFADLVGVGRRFISELENGKTTLEFDKVLQVASASGIDVLARRRR